MASVASFFPLITMIIMSMLVSLSLAQPPFGGFPPSLQIPGGAANIIQECTASFVNTGGCYFEILRAFGTTGSSQAAGFTIGPACCKAVHDISATCWSQLFPFNPLFPPMLQKYCARYINAEPYAAPAPAM